MQLKSPVFKNNQPIPPGYTCKGNNTSPPLQISDVPQPAKSLALVVSDPDAPNGTFMHWVVWDIDPTITQIRAGGAPVGASEGKNDAGGQGYTGPCPPSGTHRYIFTLYALGQPLELPGTSDGRTVRKAVQPHIIAQAELVGLFSKE